DFGPAEGDYYEIPFRSLIVRNFPNLTVACRGLSATHEAAAAVRVMATMHAVGEAAGIAAAAAAGHGKNIHHIDGAWVRSQIPYMQTGPDFDMLWEAANGYPWTLASQT